MTNGIRRVRVSTSIAQDQLLQIGTDKFGDDQILIGIIPVQSAFAEFYEITAENWGNRKVIIPAYSSPAGDPGIFIPPIYPEITKNKQVTIKARQTAVGAATEGMILLFQIKNGAYPAVMQRHMGDLHTQFMEGTATSGTSFPDSTATQNVLNEVTDDEWMPLLGSVIGDTPGETLFSHPNDDGFPPWVFATESTVLGPNTFQPIAPTNVFKGADTITMKSNDDSGSAVQGFLMTGRVAGGKTVLSNRSPFGL